MNLHTVINAGLFQITWFAAVVGGTGASIAACGLLATHALSRGGVRADLTLAAIMGVVGLCLDTLWIHTGVLDYQGSALAPVWIVALWVAVGLTLNHSLSMFIGRPWLAAVLAGGACPMSYLGGAALGGVIVPAPGYLAVVALTWAVLFGVLYGAIAPFVNRLFEDSST